MWNYRILFIGLLLISSSNVSAQSNDESNSIDLNNVHTSETSNEQFLCEVQKTACAYFKSKRRNCNELENDESVDWLKSTSEVEIKNRYGQMHSTPLILSRRFFMSCENSETPETKGKILSNIFPQ